MCREAADFGIEFQLELDLAWLVQAGILVESAAVHYSFVIYFLRPDSAYIGWVGYNSRLSGKSVILRDVRIRYRYSAIMLHKVRN